MEIGTSMAGVLGCRRVVVAFPKIDRASAERWAEVLAVRDRYDPLARAVAAHITLVFPFADPISDDDLRDHVHGAVSGVASFHVTLGGITGHEGEYLFLNVKRGNDQLVQLHDALYSEVLAAHHLRTHTFVPHLTVGRLSAGEVTAALDSTAGLTGSVAAVVDAVSVYRIEADGSRPVLFQVPLARTV